MLGVRYYIVRSCAIRRVTVYIEAVDHANALLPEFLCALPEPLLEAVPELEPMLQDLLRRARTAWPQVVLPEAVFLRYLAERLPPEQPLLKALGAVHPDGLYLCCAALRKDPAALRDLTVLARQQALAQALRLRGGEALGDELAQRLLVRLLVPEDGQPPRLSTYSGGGPLPAFLRIAALRLGLNLRAASGGAEESPLEEAALRAAVAEPQPELDLLRVRYQDAFRQALRQSFLALPQEQRNAVRLYYGGGLSGQAIANMLQVDRSTVVRWLASARAGLLADTRRRLRDELRLPPGELDSLIAAVRSQLDLSLGQVLEQSAPP